jgi:hypothetical protein
MGATMSEQHTDERSAEAFSRDPVILKSDPPLMTVADAEQIVERLVEARAALAGRLNDYGEAVRNVAFRAHALHDTEAGRELSDARDAVRDLERQLGEHDAAIKQARANVIEAQRRVGAEADVMRAKDLRDELVEFVSYGNTLAGALDVMVEASQHLRESVTRMNMLGAQNPNHFQLVALASRAIKTALLKTPFARELVDALPPAERKDFRDVVRGWQRMLETNMIRPRLAAAAEQQQEEQHGEATDAA